MFMFYLIVALVASFFIDGYKAFAWPLLLVLDVVTLVVGFVGAIRLFLTEMVN